MERRSEGSVDLEVSWRLKHRPDSQVAQVSRLEGQAQVEETVDLGEAESSVERWMPSIHKEIGVIARAVQRLPPDEVRSGGWLRRKEVKVVRSRFVVHCEATIFSLKVQLPTGQALYKRKARLVACGNHADHAPGTGSEVYASGAAAGSLRCFVVLNSKRCWCL